MEEDEKERTIFVDVVVFVFFLLILSTVYAHRVLCVYYGCVLLLPKYFTDTRQKQKRHCALYASKADSNSPIQSK